MEENQKEKLPVILVIEDDEPQLRTIYYYLWKDYNPKFADNVPDA